MTTAAAKSKYRAEQTIALSGWESGTELEIKQVVTFDITKYSPATMIDPEEPSTVENIEIRHFLGSVELQVGALVTQKFADDDGFKDWLMGEANSTDEYRRDQAADAKRDECAA